jgi:hypothetical protein
LNFSKLVAYYFFIDVIGEHASKRDEIDQVHIHRFKTILKETIITINSIRSRWIQNKSMVAIDANWETTDNKTPDGQPLPTRYGLFDSNRSERY